MKMFIGKIFFIWIYCLKMYLQMCDYWIEEIHIIKPWTHTSCQIAFHCYQWWVSLPVWPHLWQHWVFPFYGSFLLWAVRDDPGYKLDQVYSALGMTQFQDKWGRSFQHAQGEAQPSCYPHWDQREKAQVSAGPKLLFEATPWCYETARYNAGACLELCMGLNPFFL